MDDLDKKSALRALHVQMRDALSDAARAMSQNDWEHAASCYELISGWASSCRASAERNAEQERDAQ